MEKAAMDALLGRLTPVVTKVEPDAQIKSDLIVTPNTHSLESLESYQDSPNRIKRSPQLQSCESFCEYVNRFKNDTSSIYLDVPSATFTAVIDHHNPEHPSWASHTASYSPGMSLEWQAWREIHGQSLPQLSFAEFIEEHLRDITEPDANSVLKSALEFQDAKNLTMASSQNLDNGDIQFHFVKDNAAKDVTFPHRIKIAIPVFDNEPLTTIEARIRYRVSNEGVLSFKLSFVTNPQLIRRDELEKIVKNIKKNTADIHQYAGVK